LPRRRFDVVAVIKRSDAVRKSNATDTPDVRIFVLGRGQRDDGADGIIFVGAPMAAPVATSAAVAPVPPLTTATLTATTSFV
jgi:hypothetical protein